MTEPRGKSSFNLGLDCRINKCFLIMLPTSGKFGLNVTTNENSFFASFPRVPTMVVLNAIEIDAIFVRISLWNLNLSLVLRRKKNTPFIPVFPAILKTLFI